MLRFAIRNSSRYFSDQAAAGKGAARVVYIAPMQALATERLADWQAKFGTRLGLNVVELTGEPTTDHKLLEKVSARACTSVQQAQLFVPPVPSSPLIPL